MAQLKGVAQLRAQPTVVWRSYNWGNELRVVERLRGVSQPTAGLAEL
jgi:hypothetical protein